MKFLISKGVKFPTASYKEEEKNPQKSLLQAGNSFVVQNSY